MSHSMLLGWPLTYNFKEVERNFSLERFSSSFDVMMRRRRWCRNWNCEILWHFFSRTLRNGKTWILSYVILSFFQSNVSSWILSICDERQYTSNKFFAARALWKEGETDEFDWIFSSFSCLGAKWNQIFIRWNVCLWYLLWKKNLPIRIGERSNLNRVLLSLFGR